MDFLDLLRPQPKEEKGILKPLDEETKERLNTYIAQNFGTPYITQEQKEKAAEKVRVEAPKRQNPEETPRVEEHTEDKQEKVEKKEEKPEAVSSSDVKYSLPMDDDLKSLSRQADDYFENVFGKGTPSALNKVPQRYRAVAPNGFYATHVMNTFTDYLLDYINKSGLDNVEIYKRANLSKSVFSALLSKGHIPKKGTIVALAVALRLNLKETERLLMKAGYTFSNTIKGDLIAVYFISHGIYDIDKLNSALFENGEPILGSKSY